MLKDELETLRLKQSSEYLKLLEVVKLTEDLAQAIDRRDEVSVRILLTERETVLLQLPGDGCCRAGLLAESTGGRRHSPFCLVERSGTSKP